MSRALSRTTASKRRTPRAKVAAARSARVPNPVRPRTWQRTDLLVAAGLALAVFVVFGRVLGHQFLHFDDNEYIYDNPHVRTGLSLANARWALTAYHSNNWHPLTWISHMIDVGLFGLAPGPHHLMNVALHAVNAVLLFALLSAMTGARWRSAFVAAAFALHPLRVESIAWASERKDVLSGLFALVTIACYAAYSRRPSSLRYAAVVVAYAAGLMAKPMLVTLPFVLLLLDFWPLRHAGAGAAAPRLHWLDKLPLLALAVASSALTLAAQTQGGVVRTLEDLPLAMRLANAIVACSRYALKLLLPLQQAFYYPYPRTLPVAAAALSLVALVLVTAWAWRSRRERPYALVGWLWYLGMLVPVIGIVQVATQAIADRYTYLPSIGLFLVLAWGAADVVRARPAWRTPIIALAAGMLCAYAAKAYVQTGYWKDGITLFTRDTQIVEDNVLGYRNLGVALSDSARYAEAIPAFERVLVRYPHDAVTQYDIGSALEKLGRWDEARGRYEASLAADPKQPDALYNYANVLNHLGRGAEAAAALEHAVRLRPDFTLAHNNLGNTLSRLGRQDEAIAHYREALRLDPGYAEAYNNLGTTLRQAGRLPEAIDAFERALRLRPGFAAAEFNLGAVYLQQGDAATARQHFDRAIAIDPSLAKNLGGRVP